MIKTFLLFILLSAYISGFNQSFEGKLTYKVDFEIKAQKFMGVEIDKAQLIEKLKKDGEYYD